MNLNFRNVQRRENKRRVPYLPLVTLIMSACSFDQSGIDLPPCNVHVSQARKCGETENQIRCILYLGGFERGNSMEMDGFAFTLRDIIPDVKGNVLAHIEITDLNGTPPACVVYSFLIGSDKRAIIGNDVLSGSEYNYRVIIHGIESDRADVQIDRVQRSSPTPNSSDGGYTIE